MCGVRRKQKQRIFDTFNRPSILLSCETLKKRRYLASSWFFRRIFSARASTTDRFDDSLIRVKSRYATVHLKTRPSALCMLGPIMDQLTWGPVDKMTRTHNRGPCQQNSELFLTHSLRPKSRDACASKNTFSHSKDTIRHNEPSYTIQFFTCLSLRLHLARGE